MSDRERWIVYPLLLFSLGIGMGGKLYPSHDLKTDELHTDKIICRTVEIQGTHQELLVRLGAMYFPAANAPESPHAAGAIELYGRNGVPVVSLKGHQEGVVQVHAPAPQRGIALTPSGTTSIPGQVAPPETRK